MAIEEGKNAIPIWQVVRLSYIDGYNYCQQLKFPILIITIVILAQWKIPLFSWGWWGIAFRWILELIFILPFVVCIHRIVLLNELPSGTTFFNFLKAVFHYLGVALVLGILFIGGFISVTNLQSHGPLMKFYAIILKIALFFFLFRLGLSLPGAAIGAKHTFTESWNSTRGSLWRLLWITFLTWLPAILITGGLGLYFLASIMSGNKSDQSYSIFPGLFLLALISFLQTILLTITMVAYSLCYDVLVRGRRLESVPPL
jgi:hypothetical protein